LPLWARLICRNVCVLIQSQCEVEIDSVFWQNEANDKDEAPAVLRMVRPGQRPG
jgi:hypothetical protein